jgi:hypothetical protein
VKDVYAWNNYDKKNPLPSVDHAVTIITNADGTLTWLDPTAKQGSSGVPVTADEVLAFAGGNRTDYPVRMIKQGALAVTSGGLPAAGGGDSTTPTPDPYGPAGTAVTNILTPFIGKTFGELKSDPAASSAVNWATIMEKLGKTQDTDKLTADDVANLAKQVTSTDPLTSIANTAAAAVGFLGKLTNPVNWLHIGAMLAGLGLVGFGLVMAARDLSSSGPEGMVNPMPIILKEGA